MYGYNEYNMPTTKKLLPSSHEMSMNLRDAIDAKLYSEKKLHLPSLDEELRDRRSAQLRIVDIVGVIRESTRESNMLFRYNIEYGFFRNGTGAALLGLMIVLLCIVLNWSRPVVSWQILLLLGGFQVVCFFVCYCLAWYKANEYAHCLFSTYLNQEGKGVYNS
jgi:hypothetical protein